MPIKKVAIIGSGTMGQGIAQWMAQQGVETFLVDKEVTLAQKAQLSIHQSWQKLESKGKFNSSQIKTFKEMLACKDLVEIPSDCDLVVEAIFEDLKLKKDLFSKLNQLMSQQTIFASNTSSFKIADVQNDLPQARQKNFLGLHFFNPAAIMKLVEVIPGPLCQDKISNRLIEFFNQKGKSPVQCQDGPGFIVNRLARHFYGESLRAAEILSFDEIDQVMKCVGGFKMGPFELLDLIGIDVNLQVTKSVYQAFGKASRFAPHPIQEDYVKKGWFGRKTQRGFYPYE